MVDVLKLDTGTNILWLPVIMGLGPGLILTIGYSKSLYDGDNFIKKTNRLGGGYTAGGRAISDIFQLILELIISKKAIKRSRGNLIYAVCYGLLISLIEVGIVSLVVMAVIKLS